MRVSSEQITVSTVKSVVAIVVFFSGIFWFIADIREKGALNAQAILNLKETVEKNDRNSKDEFTSVNYKLDTLIGKQQGIQAVEIVNKAIQTLVRDNPEEL